MAIYIKGLLAPSCCAGCDPDFGTFIGCDKWKKADFIHERPKDCPLIEIDEPHGRLIDADAICDEMKEYSNMVFKTGYLVSAKNKFYKLNELLEEAPTVTEGSE